MSLESPQLTSPDLAGPRPAVLVADDGASNDDAFIVPPLSSTKKGNSPYVNEETDAPSMHRTPDDPSSTTKTLPDGPDSDTKSSSTPNKYSLPSEQTALDKQSSEQGGGLRVGAFPADNKDIVDRMDYGTPRSLSSFETRVQQKYADDVASKKGYGTPRSLSTFEARVQQKYADDSDDKRGYGTPRSLSSFEAQVQQKYDDDSIRPPALQASASMGTPGRQAGASDTDDVPRSTSMPTPAAAGQYRLRSGGDKGSPDSASPESGEEVFVAGEPLGPGAFSVQGRAMGGAPAWARGRRRRNSSTRRSRRRSRRSSTENSRSRSGSRRSLFQTLLSFRSSTATDQSHIPPELRVSDQSNIPPELRVSNNTTGETLNTTLPVPSSTTSVSGQHSDIEAVCNPVVDNANSTKGQKQRSKGDTKVERPVRIWMLLLLVVVAVVVIIVVALPKKKDAVKTTNDSQNDDLVDPRKAALQASFESMTANMSVFDDPLSAQSLALGWLVERDGVAADETDNIRLQTRYALAVLYYATNGDGWIDKNSFLSSVHECNWTSSPGLIAGGITCDASLQITSLDIGMSFRTYLTLLKMELHSICCT